jgi:hypothetical protein
MLEILFLVWFVRKLSSIAKAKGRGGGWGALGALFWIGGEIIGFIVGASVSAGGGAYGLALLFAAVGAVVAYVIVNSLGPSEFAMAAGGGDDTGNPHYDPKNPYSPPR